MGTLLAPVPEVIFANRYRGSQDVVVHEHVGVEFVLVQSGRCRVTVGGFALEAGPGEAFILPAGVPHDQANAGEVETLYAEIAVPARQFGDRPRVVPMPLDGCAATWLRHLVQLELEPSPPAVRNGLALALISHVAHLDQRDAEHRALHPAVVKALHRLEEGLLEELAVADVAAAAGVSVSHLTTLFRDQLGCGPMAWQQRQRLDLACRLLRNPYLAISEVAASCGYRDTNYFARLFRQLHGCSPSTWRERASR